MEALAVLLVGLLVVLSLASWQQSGINNSFLRLHALNKDMIDNTFEYVVLIDARLTALEKKLLGDKDKEGSE